MGQRLWGWGRGVGGVHSWASVYGCGGGGLGEFIHGPASMGVGEGGVHSWASVYGGGGWGSSFMGQRLGGSGRGFGGVHSWACVEQALVCVRNVWSVNTEEELTMSCSQSTKW